MGSGAQPPVTVLKTVVQVMGVGAAEARNQVGLDLGLGHTD